MTEHKFQKGDWCFHEFKLAQITDVEQGRVTGVSTGYFETSGYDLAVLPLNVDSKLLSGEFEFLYEKLRSAAANTNINYSGIKNKLTNMWLHASKANEGATNANNFVEAIIDKIREVKSMEIQGVQLFR